MKERKRVQIGDTVLWKGRELGVQTATVVRIERHPDPFTHNGEEVDSLQWKTVKKNATIVFTNGYWDDGRNIRRLRQPRAWGERYAHGQTKSTAHTRTRIKEASE
jgi:hypothetical protein